MKRLDESDDGNFYDEPRLVYHIDAGAVAALTHYYQTTVDPSPPGFSVLDVSFYFFCFCSETFQYLLRAIDLLFKILL